MHYLITGGAGFIGSNIVEELVRRGETVRVLDNFSTGFRENLDRWHASIEIVEGSIEDYRVVRESMEGIDCILHQAALPSVPRSIKDPMATNQTNVTGTLNVLEAARDARISRAVFASSSSVYGDTPTLPKQEDMPTKPLSPYAVSKLAGESYFAVFGKVYGMQTVVLRYFNVFGPRQNPHSQYSAVIPKFIKAMLAGERPVIYGDGTQSRDFTFIQNVVEANLKAVSLDVPPGSIMNCACHGQVTLNDLIAHLNSILGTDLAPQYAEPRAGDIKHSFADIERMKGLLHYTPNVDFETGLRKTCDFYASAVGEKPKK